MLEWERCTHLIAICTWIYCANAKTMAQCSLLSMVMGYEERRKRARSSPGCVVSWLLPLLHVTHISPETLKLLRNGNDESFQFSRSLFLLSFFVCWTWRVLNFYSPVNIMFIFRFSPSFSLSLHPRFVIFVCNPYRTYNVPVIIKRQMNSVKWMCL